MYPIKDLINQLKLLGLKVSQTGDHDWHTGFTVKGNYKECRITFTFTEMPTGCGLISVTGFAYSDLNENTTELLKMILDVYKQDGAGTCIATLGHQYTKEEKYLLDFGFIKAHEYPNMRHGGENYTQQLYYYTHP